MSNTERQRRFRERNPGYYGRLHRKRKAEMLEYRAKREAFEAWWKACLQAKLPALPSPEQVSTRAGDGFIQQIQDAVNHRNNEERALIAGHGPRAQPGAVG